MATLNHELLAAMYQADEEEVSPDKKVAGPFPDRGLANLPTIVAELRRMQRLIDDQQRIIRRLENRLKYVERKANIASGEIGDVRRDLDGKMDRF